MDIKMIVATHKPYRMPDDSMYVPVHAGRAGKSDIGYAGDDTGDNISTRNAYYSELTVIYWAWKNLEADAIGICHYRRHFSKRTFLSYLFHGKWNSIINKEHLKRLLRSYDIITPNKRRYRIQTNESHYSCSHNPYELKLMRVLISERCPEYEQGYDVVLKRTWAHMFNMYIMKKDIFDSYCTWMFDLLFEFERRIDISQYIQSQKRAFIDELLLDTWLETNKLTYKEVPVMYMEKQSWLRKGGAMVWRRLKGFRSGY